MKLARSVLVPLPDEVTPARLTDSESRPQRLEIHLVVLVRLAMSTALTATAALVGAVQLLLPLARPLLLLRLSHLHLLDLQSPLGSIVAHWNRSLELLLLLSLLLSLSLCKVVLLVRLLLGLRLRLLLCGGALLGLGVLLLLLLLRLSLLHLSLLLLLRLRLLLLGHLLQTALELVVLLMLRALLRIQSV